jgi:tRNA(fMet)-specific endonuclease VapC
MSFQYLLDTNTLSEPARPIPNANVLLKLEVCQSEIVTASIVVHELMYG